MNPLDIESRQPRPTALLRPTLVACEECDWLHRRVNFPEGYQAHCERCDAPLGKALPASLDLSIAFALSGLVMLFVAHLHPVFGIGVQGQTHSSSLWQAAMTLYDEDAWFLSVLVIATTLVFPAAELGAICYLLIPLRSDKMAPGFAKVLRVMQVVKPWVMVEVFMLGVLIAVAKLSGLADILPGIGLWSFAAVMLLMACTAASFDYHSLWHHAEVKRSAEKLKSPETY